ncbi:hypothetical protein JCM33374_g3229 [Metschnikowia sp. JCM 33374]|nr:hypothetical protein JCM33374_g3229 [Metschnikowia sp. JCM 33374]
MKLFHLLMFVVTTMAWSWPDIGGLYISKVANIETHINLGFSYNRFVIDEDSLVSYKESEGWIGPVLGWKYMGVENGTFILQEAPDKNFRLVPDKDPRAHRTMAYRNSTDFILCGNNSIVFQTNCTGGVPVTIKFQNLFGV